MSTFSLSVFQKIMIIFNEMIVFFYVLGLYLYIYFLKLWLLAAEQDVNMTHSASADYRVQMFIIFLNTMISTNHIHALVHLLPGLCSIFLQVSCDYLFLNLLWIIAE